MARVVLLHPPLADFTVPPEVLATQKAACTARGVETLTIDVNLRAMLDMLSRERLAELGALCEARVSALVKRVFLGFWEQQELLTLIAALGDGLRAAEMAPEAISTARSERYYAREAQAQFAKTVESALRLVSATSFPFELSVAGISAPFLTTSAQAAARYQAIDPFKPTNDRLVAELHHKKPEAIFIALMEPSQLLPALALAAALRAAFPAVHLGCFGALAAQIAAGGADATAAETAIGVLFSRFDSVVTHSAERTLPDVAEMALAGKLKAMGGVRFAPALNVKAGKETVPPHDVHALTVPDYSDMSIADYVSPLPVLAYRPSRGRWLSRASLNWIGLQHNAERRKLVPPALVAEHWKTLIEQHQAKLFLLTGDVLTPTWLLELATELQGTVVRFTAEIDLDGETIDAARAERLKTAGCVSVVLGLNDASLAGRTQAFFESIDALAHAGIAVQLDACASLPGGLGIDEDRVLASRSRAQEIDLFNVYEALKEPGRRWRVDASALPQAFFFGGDEARLCPEGSPNNLAALQLSECERVQANYAARRWPLAGAVGSPHTAVTFEKWGRRALAYVPRALHGNTRILSDGERVRLSPTAKMLWIPYQLSVFEEVAREEVEIRDLDLRRRTRDLSADKVWSYSDRGDLKLRAAERTPHILGPGMPAQEISIALAEALAQVQEQFVPVAQLVARAPRELRDALRRQIGNLFQHGALETEGQTRRNDSPEQRNNGSNGGGGSNGGRGGGPGGGGGPPGAPGQGKRRRRRRGRGRGEGGGGPPRIGAP